MAYVTTNPPCLTAQRVGSYLRGGAIWSYGSVDLLATVVGAGYITNAVDLDMRLGDVVHVFDSATPLVTDCWVSDVDDATGSATLTAII